ncbi:MAG: hypothetical protein ACRC7S_10100 [Cetobacterium sp.]
MNDLLLTIGIPYQLPKGETLMSKMTFNFTASFDVTAIAGVEQFKSMLENLRKSTKHKDFDKLPAREKMFTQLVVRAADRSLEEGIAELIRFSMRTGLNELMAEELAHKEDGLTIRPSPVKLVCHGLEVKA